MKLEPGIYKLKRRGSFLIGNRFHYIMVYFKGKDKYIRLDSMDPQLVTKEDEEWYLDGFIVVKKLPKGFKVEYNRAAKLYRWVDEDGDTFEMEFKSEGACQKFESRSPGFIRAMGGSSKRSKY